MAYELPKLPYGYDALEPYIDTKTMIIHHMKHHQTYINNLNAALKDYPELQAVPVEDLISRLDLVPKEIRTAVQNNGGGHANHSMFWKVLSPHSGKPSATLAKEIDNCFGSFDSFKAQFTGAAQGRFGSGWAWLVCDGGHLRIMSTPNQDSPISEGKTPILCLDVWEHAYYLNYQNRRPDYINAFWNIVNWDEVSKRFESC